MLDQILEQCQHLKCYEKRSIKAEYVEVVIYRDELEGWQEILSQNLGHRRPAICYLHNTTHTKMQLCIWSWKLLHIRIIKQSDVVLVQLTH